MTIGFQCGRAAMPNPSGVVDAYMSEIEKYEESVPPWVSRARTVLLMFSLLTMAAATAMSMTPG